MLNVGYFAIDKNVPTGTLNQRDGGKRFVSSDPLKKGKVLARLPGIVRNASISCGDASIFVKRRFFPYLAQPSSYFRMLLWFECPSIPSVKCRL